MPQRTGWRPPALRPSVWLSGGYFWYFAGIGCFGPYIALYYAELGGDVALVGLASAIGAISELPVMLFGSRLLDRFSSRNILSFAIAMYVVRLLCYAIPPDVSVVALVQLLHGLSFGLYLMAAVTFMHELAGRERAATAQGLLGATSQGFAAVTGALLGGLLLDRIGALGLLRVATAGMGIALIVCLVGVRALDRLRPADRPA